MFIKITTFFAKEYSTLYKYAQHVVIAEEKSRPYHELRVIFFKCLVHLHKPSRVEHLKSDKAARFIISEIS